VESVPAPGEYVREAPDRNFPPSPLRLPNFCGPTAGWIIEMILQLEPNRQEVIAPPAPNGLPEMVESNIHWPRIAGRY
jgi:hypothetical protein